MSELALPDPSRGASLPDKIRYAEALAHAGLLPSQYRDKPANVLFAMEYAEALGLPTITAITSVHVIDGKPSASADLIAFLVRRAGHKLRIKGDDTKASAVIIRADDPDFPFEVEWDQAKAEKAGLWGKGNWAKYPAAMLKARCISEVARMGANDALFGIVYTPEELRPDAEVAEDGTPIITDAPPAPPRARQAQPRPLHVVSDQGPATPAAPAEDPEVKAEADAEWLERIAGVDSAEEGRALYREAKEAGQLRRVLQVTDGEATATAELYEWIGLRVQALTTPAETEAPAEAEAEPAPEEEPAGETPTDPPAEETKPEALEGEVLDKPKPAPVEDPADMCRNTAQRKAVENELMHLFGGQEAAVAAIEDEFGVDHTKVSTKRLREFMTREQQANAAGQAG